jgi:protein TonB
MKTSLRKASPTLLASALVAALLSAVAPVAVAAEAPEKPEAVLDLRQLQQPPKAVKQVPPVYPYELKKKRIQGEALIMFIVDHSGTVRDVTVKRCTHPDMGAAAAEAVSQWVFEPGIKDGKAVHTRMMVPIRFNLH